VTIARADLLTWYDHADRAAGARLIDALGPRVALPASFGGVLGAEVAEEVEQDALVRLLDRDRRLLLDADDPLSYAATVARNLARDALRRIRRRGDLSASREPLDQGALPAVPPRDASANLDAERALALLQQLGEDARLAVFLVHAPERMPDEDWRLLEGRQETPRLAHPAGSLDREEASRLLWPPPVAETQPARRRRLERIRKVLFRAYAQLAAALGAE
jgi:RNA polymerase sigma factor (sigma-70 family)